MPEAVREIFLSYAGADRERVARLVHALEEDGLRIWWDQDIGDGQIFHRSIEQALTRAPCVVVVWSRESIRSEWVINEASDARGAADPRRLVLAAARGSTLAWSDAGESP